MRFYRPHLIFLVPILWLVLWLPLLLVWVCVLIDEAVHIFETDEERLAKQEYEW